MSLDRRTLVRINKEDLPKFRRIFDIVEASEGSQNKAMKALGLSTNSMYQLLNDEVLSIKNARRMLEAYKRWKAGKPEGVTA